MLVLRFLYFIAFLIASILGICAQGMAYFMDDIYSLGAPVYYVNIFIKTSWYIYIFLIIYLWVVRKKYNQSKWVDDLAILICVGGLVTCWSFLVWALWQG